ncbi:MAG: LamG-like jellyroll fold domain-containing protein [Verrucomicrobiota bacterium]
MNGSKEQTYQKVGFFAGDGRPIPVGLRLAGVEMDRLCSRRKDPFMKTTTTLFGILNITAALWLGLPANAAQQTIIFSSSLILDLPLDDSVVDVGPNNFPVTTYGGGTWVPDRFSQANSALSLNGVNQNIAIPYDARLYPDEFTLSGWFNFQQLSEVAILWQVGNATSDGWHGFALTFRGYDFDYQDYTGSGFNAILSVALTNFVANEWCQIVVTRTSDSAAVFVNGVNVASQTGLTPYTKPQVTPMSLGADNGISSGFYQFCPVTVDTVHIYNRALSSNEVAQMYAYESVPEPSVLGLLAAGTLGIILFRRRQR